jgi:hypothetical protein
MGKVFATKRAGYAGERVGDIGRGRNNTGNVWENVWGELLERSSPHTPFKNF